MTSMFVFRRNAYQTPRPVQRIDLLDEKRGKCTGQHKAKVFDPSFGYDLYNDVLPLAGAWSNWNTKFDRHRIPHISILTGSLTFLPK